MVEVEFLESFGYIGIIILVLLGLALAFFGRRIMETIAFVIGAIIGAALALMYAPALYTYVEEYISLNMCIIIAVIIGALIGGYLGKSLMYGMISLLIALTCAGAVFALTGNWLTSLIVFVIVLIIMWFIVEKFLAVVTAFLGGCMVGLGVMIITASLGIISFILFIFIAAILTIFGARYQLQEE